MKVYLINTPQENLSITRDMAGGLGFDASDETMLPPLELALYASILRGKKNRVRIIDPLVDNIKSEGIIRECIENRPDFIITTFSLPSFRNDASFANTLKNITSATILVKTSITFPPILKKFLQDSLVDACLVGEPEQVINKIVNGKTKEGLAFIVKGKLVINIPEPIKQLDKLPLPARDLLNNHRYQYPLLGSNTTIIQTSRGCPYPCGYYCPYPLVQGKTWRPMSPQRVYEELEDIVRKHKIKNVLFRDATFTLDQNRAAAIMNLIIKGKLKFSWWCETRLNCLNEDLLKLMKKAGCKGMNVGVETGNDEVMRRQGKPGVNLVLLSKIKTVTDKLGIKLHFLLLVGLPDETKKTIHSTFQLIRRLRPYSLGVTVITPYPGTQLYDEAIKKGWIETQDWSRYSGDIITMHTDNLKSWEMKMYQKLIQAEMMLTKKGFLGEIGLFLEDIFFRILALL